MRLLSILFLCLLTVASAFAQSRPGDPYYDDAPPSPCGPINPDQLCVSAAGLPVYRHWRVQSVRA